MVHILCLVSLALSINAGAQTPQRFLIKFKENIPVDVARDRLAASNLLHERRLNELGIDIAVAAETQASAEKIVARLEKSSDILYAEVDREIRAFIAPAPAPLQIPNDPHFFEQSHLQEINADIAWNLSTGSRSTLVAVTDTGMATAHSDLRRQLWTNPQEILGNGIDDDRNGWIDDIHGWNFSASNNYPEDDQGHGSHVSGIIGAEGNNFDGITGVNWNVSLLPVKFLNAQGSGSTSAGIQSILYATNAGARIINASWGSPTPSQALNDAMDYAYRNGALVIAAAGNDSDNTDKYPTYPSSAPSLGVLSVAATAEPGVLAGFSNYGLLSVDLAAPGYGILSTFLYNNYTRMSGTSMAAPMVAGVGALMLSVKPQLTVLELRNALLNATIPYASLTRAVATGGAINAAKALEQLSGGFQVWPERLTLSVGNAYPLSAYNGNGNVQWSVDAPEIASIQASGPKTGIITFKQAGSVRVTAVDASGAIAQEASLRGSTISANTSRGCKRGKQQRTQATPWEQLGDTVSLSLPLLFGFLFRVRRPNSP